MEPNDMKRSWNEQKNILQKRIADIVENEFLFSEDKKREILENVQIKLGNTRKVNQVIQSEF